MPIYDLHRHLWPEPLIAELRSRTTPPFLRGNTLEVAVEGPYEIDSDAYGLSACLDDLDRNGIDVAVVSCPPTLGIEQLPPSQARVLLDAYHEGVLEAVEQSGGRLKALSLGEPLDGFVGTVLAADDLDDLDRLAPALHELERRGTFAFVHPGVSNPPRRAPVWWVAGVAYTGQMQRAYARWLAYGVPRWPTLKVVFAILAGGAPFQLERLAQRGRDVRSTLDPNVYLDVASYGRRSIGLCAQTFGAENLLYGSDRPVVDPAPTLKAVRGFGESMEKLITVDNPTALLR